MSHRYRFQETVGFSPVVKLAYFVLLATLVYVVLNGLRSTPLALLPVAALFLLLPLIFGRLSILVDEEALQLRFGYLGWPAKRFELADIVSSEVVTYRPIREFGGWGIRCGRFRGETTGAYTLFGNRAVLLHLRAAVHVGLGRASRFLVGTSEAERLQSVLSR